MMMILLLVEVCSPFILSLELSVSIEYVLLDRADLVLKDRVAQRPTTTNC